MRECVIWLETESEKEKKKKHIKKREAERRRERRKKTIAKYNIKKRNLRQTKAKGKSQKKESEITPDFSKSKHSPIQTLKSSHEGRGGESRRREEGTAHKKNEKKTR